MEYLYAWLHRLTSATHTHWRFLRHCIQMYWISMRFDVFKYLITVRIFYWLNDSCWVIVNIVVNTVKCSLLGRSLTPVQGCHPQQRTIMKLVLILKAPFTNAVCVCVCVRVRARSHVLSYVRVWAYSVADCTVLYTGLDRFWWNHVWASRYCKAYMFGISWQHDSRTEWYTNLRRVLH
jgi:hypothetical protein